MFKFIFTLVPSHADADDILQDTSVILWQKFGEFAVGSNFLRWASTVAFNKVRDFRKKLARDRLRFWTDDLIEAIAETHWSERESLVRQRSLLAGCVRELDQRDRELIRQYFSRRLTIKAVAEQLGRPANTVYKALNRVRKALMDCVAREEGRNRAGRLP
ncbi:MAG: sigma-70 family RNA polymerase sigma factor [Pirellulales bacterium]|nr:sigma-70 family RNA polymerase sigma factor [Pirellulales bacterium]